LENSPNILFLFVNFIAVIQPKFFRETAAFADSAIFIIELSIPHWCSRQKSEMSELRCMSVFC